MFGKHQERLCALRSLTRGFGIGGICREVKVKRLPKVLRSWLKTGNNQRLVEQFDTALYMVTSAGQSLDLDTHGPKSLDLFPDTGTAEPQ
jgi:hypothetical protein